MKYHPTWEEELKMSTVPRCACVSGVPDIRCAIVTEAELLGERTIYEKEDKSRN